MVVNAAVRDEQAIADLKAGIRQEVLPIWDGQLSPSCVLVYGSVAGTAFPAAQHVDESHVEVASNKHILAHSAFAVSVVHLIFCRWDDVHVRAVNGCKGILEVGEPISVASSDLGRCLWSWELKVRSVEVRVENRVENTIKLSAKL